MRIEWNEQARAWRVEGTDREVYPVPAALRRYDILRRCWWVPELGWSWLEKAATAVAAQTAEHGGLFSRYHVSGEAMHVEPAPTARPLLPHQKPAISHLLGLKRAGLFDDMGLCKTSSVLAAYHTLKQQVPGLRLLVLCPKRVLSEWANELRLTLGRAPDDEHEVFLNYDRVWRENHFLPLRYLTEQHPTVLVLDECHVAAGVESKRFLAIDALSQRAGYVWALSGTPVRNKPESFFPVYKLISGAAVTREQFLEAYCKTVQNRIVGYKHLDKLEAVTRQYCLRREVNDVLTLPPLTEQKVSVTLYGKQRLRYNEKAEDLAFATSRLRDPDTDDGGASRILVAVNAMMMAASHPALVDEEAGDEECAKLEAIDELVEEAGDQKILVWSRYPRVLERIAARLSRHGHLAVTMHGENSDKQNAEAKRRFTTDPAIKVCCLSLGAFGEGVNLQCATIAIYHDIYWTWSQFHQSQRRLWRTGQTKPVHLYYLLARGSIEEHVYDALQAKEQYQDVITGRAKGFDPLKPSLLKSLRKKI